MRECEKTLESIEDPCMKKYGSKKTCEDYMLMIFNCTLDVLCAKCHPSAALSMDKHFRANAKAKLASKYPKCKPEINLDEPYCKYEVSVLQWQL